MTVLPAHVTNDPCVRKLVAVLGAADGMTRLVGGVVRDALIGLPVNDVDLATRLLPAEVQARATNAGFKAIPTGIAHGTLTVVVDRRAFEITTLRRDIATDGRRATVDFTCDWALDAARRDFTINALYADPLTGDVHDYTGGLDDLMARRIRFIGAAGDRIAEDHLRILRFFRFLARFGDVRDADAPTLAVLSANANSLMALSRERIADELRKILGLPDPSAVIALMISHGIFAPVLPEIADAGPLTQLIADEMAQQFAPSWVRRLAALLGQHPRTAHDVSIRLRLSKAEQKSLALACTPHDDDAHPAALAYWIGRDAAISRRLLSGADARDLHRWERPALPLTGGMIVALGVQAGPDVARILQSVERQWVTEGFPAAARVSALVNAEVSQV